MYDHLPGGDILRLGLEDLRAGVRSINALLVLVAAPRLTRCGIQVHRRDPHSVLPSTICIKLCRRSTGRKLIAIIDP